MWSVFTQDLLTIGLDSVIFTIYIRDRDEIKNIVSWNTLYKNNIEIDYGTMLVLYNNNKWFSIGRGDILIFRCKPVGLTSTLITVS